MKTILIIIGGAILVFVLKAYTGQETEKQSAYLAGGDSNSKAPRMKIKKSILNEPDPKAAWNKLIDTHLPDFDEKTRDQLDEVSFTFSLLVGLNNQVMNGGFIQFADNWDGAYFHETVEAAKRIKHHELVDMLSKVAEAFPKKQVPKDWEKRRSAIDEINDKGLSDSWDNLDKQYYATDQTLYKLTVVYLKENAVLIDE
jgi:hypothetical protein